MGAAWPRRVYRECTVVDAVCCVCVVDEAFPSGLVLFLILYIVRLDGFDFGFFDNRLILHSLRNHPHHTPYQQNPRPNIPLLSPLADLLPRPIHLLPRTAHLAPPRLRCVPESTNPGDLFAAEHPG